MVLYVVGWFRVIIKPCCVYGKADLLILMYYHLAVIVLYINSRFLTYSNMAFSCCVDEVAAQHVGADCLIHFGHACLSRYWYILRLFKCLPVYDVEYEPCYL